MVARTVRQAWLDAHKGAAMLLVVAVHAVERSLGGTWWANPADDWPSLGRRIEQWRPAAGDAWTIVANPVRWIAWLGDLAPSLFVLASGFLLAHESAARLAPYGREVARRLARFLPMFWIVFVAAAAAAMATGRDTPSPADGAFWLSLVGFRATRGTIYYGTGAWWYVGFLVQLAFVAPPLVRLVATSAPAARRRAAALVAGALALKAVLLVALVGSPQLDPMARGGVIAGKLPELTAGLLLGVLVRDAPDVRAAVRRQLRLPVSVAALVVGFGAAFTLVGNAFASVLAAVGSAGVCAHAVADGRHVIARAGTFLSRHSLAIFLAHPLALQLTPAGPVPLDTRVAARLAAALVVGIGCGLALQWVHDRSVRAVRSLRAPAVPAEPSVG
jgi:peptidoglycan/LPS O-acetylase OafA/YrhL